jgi:signal recognition particle receptor subunit beta
MSFINYMAREINCKIVYYGPGLCGKTTNLQYIYERTNPEAKGKMISLATERTARSSSTSSRSSLGEIRGFKTRFHLYTVPGQVFYDASRKLILKGVDGVVFVADSQIARIEANQESLENLRTNLAEQGYSLEKLPFVIQYNKRDLPDIAPVEELRELLNPTNVPDYEAVARTGVGVFDTLKAVAKLVLTELKRGAAAVAVAARLGRAGGGLVVVAGVARPPGRGRLDVEGDLTEVEALAVRDDRGDAGVVDLDLLEVAREGAARVELALDGGDVHGALGGEVEPNRRLPVVVLEDEEAVDRVAAGVEVEVGREARADAGPDRDDEVGVRAAERRGRGARQAVAGGAEVGALDGRAADRAAAAAVTVAAAAVVRRVAGAAFAALTTTRATAATRGRGVVTTGNQNAHQTNRERTKEQASH